MSTIDLSYKDNAEQVYYDIEVLHDIFTIFMLTKEKASLHLVTTDHYWSIDQSRLYDILQQFSTSDQVLSYCETPPEVEIYWYKTIDDFKQLRRHLDCILQSESIWEPNRFTEYRGWNSSRYDLPMLCVARMLLAKFDTLSTESMRAVSDAIIEFDGPNWRMFDFIEERTKIITKRALRERLNVVYYYDGHIDLAKIARTIDGGEEAKFPPGLKKEMARYGLDIVVDESVSANEYKQLTDEEFLQLCAYNANDVVGTAMVAQNATIVSGIETRDIVRRMYPHTCARTVPIDKIGKWTPLERDATAAQITGAVLVGERRIKPEDYPAVNLSFPVAEGPVDLLDYMRDNEEFMHPMLYAFFDHFRGKDTTTSHQDWMVKQSQPINGKSALNIPYYRDGKPVDTFIRISTGGAHGSVMAGLSKYTEEQINSWIRSDQQPEGKQKPTIDVQNAVHLDWSSFYPVMASKLQMYTTAEGIDRYTDVIKERFHLKEKSKSFPKDRNEWTREQFYENEAQMGLKFILNSATGAGNMHNKYALLPLDNKTLSMRLIGNMLIWCLGQRLTQAGAYVLSTNTDGLYVCNMSLETAQHVVNDYVDMYAMDVEPEIIPRFINRDVSNRVEYGDPNKPNAITTVGGRLRHARNMEYNDFSIGANVPYPLVASRAVLDYMEDPNWLTEPYDRKKLEDIIERRWQESCAKEHNKPEAWYQIHVGSSNRRLLLNGERLGHVNRVVLTTEGDQLGLETSRFLTKGEALDIISRLEHSSFEQICQDMGIRLSMTLPDEYQLISYKKSANDELVETTDIDVVRNGGDASPKLAIKTTQGKIIPIKHWKESSLVGYTSDRGIVLNTRASLEEFDMNLIDKRAYVDWAESILEGWKQTGDIEEIGMVSLDDTVTHKISSTRSNTKASKAMAQLEALYKESLQF